ncbi:AAA family ATPase [Agromyces sp. CCNWLW203]|uniref:AAA family ATPase n=1 Tax=Agromyces sp. CCNWLW203 TaxID=3112842 RepID=UPI002F96B2A4
MQDYAGLVLVRFEVSNYRSIASPVELSFVAIDRDRPEVHFQESIGEGLLAVAAVFGPNASGKSNVVSAMGWLRDAVRNSVRFWEDDIPTEPFAFGPDKLQTSEFVLEAMVDGVRFEYRLELDAAKVSYEALFHYPEKKRRRVFERDDAGLKLQRGLGSLSGTRELLTDRTLALSVARRFDEPLVRKFAHEILQIQTLGQLPRRRRTGGGAWRNPVGYMSTMRWFDNFDQPTLFDDLEVDLTNGQRDAALSLLRLADLGIDDVVIDERKVDYPDGSSPRRERRVRLVHKTASMSAPLDFADESEGTRTWFHLIGPVLSALQEGSAVVFDELDASLHPTLSAELVNIFKSSVMNPFGAQLIFTSHDTSLLNHLNRDEVWLTEKLPDGSTRLGALAEFAGERVRRSQNLESAYLHGRFGALPQVDQAAFLRSLGLIG